jgi:lambda family phage tail tape measure protein
VEIEAKAKGEQQVKKIVDSLYRMEKSAKSTANSLLKFRTAFNSIAGFSIAGLGIKSLVDFSDSIQLLTSRVKLLAKEGEDPIQSLEKIGIAASSNRQSIEDYATSFTRLGQALKRVGLDTDELIAANNLLTKTFLISGSNAGETTGAIIQLSQGLGSGAVQGQELRSVLEANTKIAQILSDKFLRNAETGEQLKESLFRLSEKRGGFTAAEFFGALVERSDELNKEFGTLSMTIGQALTVALNKAQIAWAQFNEKAGVSESIVKGITFLTDNAIPALSIAIGVTLVASIGKLKVALDFLATSGIAKALLGITTLAGALAALKIVALVGAISSVVYAILNWESVSKRLQYWLDIVGLKVATLKERFAEMMATISEKAGIDAFTKRFKAMADLARKQQEQSKTGIKNFEDSQKILKDTATETDKLASAYEKLAKSGAEDKLVTLNKNYIAGLVPLKQYREELKKINLLKLNEEAKAGKIGGDEYEKRKLEILTGGKLSKVTNNLAILNRTWESGAVSTRDYFAKMDVEKLKDLNNRFKQGQGDLEAYTDAQRNIQIKLLNELFKDGKTSLEDYNKVLDSIRLEELNFKLSANLITLREYNEEVTKLQTTLNQGAAFQVGVQNYLDSIGTLGSGIASVVTNAFQSLEDNLVNMVKTGKFEFKQFAQSVLDDINRIIIRMTVVKPLANAALSYFGGGYDYAGNAKVIGTSGADANYGTVASAKGNAFYGGITPFAKGGMVHQPTMFKYGGTATGIMGENGSEAILPLKRGSDGNLGVRATTPTVMVNVINNSKDSETKQVERTDSNGNRVIDVIILNKVREAIANGSLDKSFESTYNLKRRGN